MTDEIRADVLKELRQAAEANTVTADKYRTDADAKQAEANEMRARAGYFTAMADRWTRIAILIEDGTFDLDYLLSGDDLGEARKTNEAAPDSDPATEAFVDMADAERYALRDEYVNSAEPALVPPFADNDLVNISDPDHKLFGTRGSVIGFLYPDGVVVEYDNHGSTATVTVAQLMHHTEFVKQSDEFFAAGELATRDAESGS